MPLKCDINIAWNGPFWMEIANPEHPYTAPASFHDKFFPMHISVMRPRSARPPPTTFATSSPKLALVPLLWPSIFVLLLALRSLRSVASVSLLTPFVCAMELPTLNNSKPRRSYYSLVRLYCNEQIGLKFDLTLLSSSFSGFEFYPLSVAGKPEASSSLDQL